MLPLIMLGANPANHPWLLGLINYRGEFATELNRVLTFSVNLLPAVAFFLLTQRYIAAGQTSGAVKGLRVEVWRGGKVATKVACPPTRAHRAFELLTYGDSHDIHSP